jgi:hypothetical protein
MGWQGLRSARRWACVSLLWLWQALATAAELVAVVNGAHAARLAHRTQMHWRPTETKRNAPRGGVLFGAAQSPTSPSTRTATPPPSPPALRRCVSERARCGQRERAQHAADPRVISGLPVRRSIANSRTTPRRARPARRRNEAPAPPRRRFASMGRWCVWHGSQSAGSLSCVRPTELTCK